MTAVHRDKFTIARQRSPQREARADARQVIVAAREARESLSAVVKLCERRRAQTTSVTEAGEFLTTWVRQTDADLLASLRQLYTMQKDRDAEKHPEAEAA